jgi:hypothetical protein
MKPHGPDDAPGSRDSDGRDSLSRSDLNQTREEVLEYWTEQRMAEAKPRELRLPDKDPLRQRTADTGNSETGSTD